MTKIPLTLLIALSSTLFTNEATAQNKPIACQGEAAAGLKWEKGQWVATTFITRKFILVQAGNTLTLDSAAKALSAPSTYVTCKNVSPQIVCNDIAGNSLYLDPITRTGGIASLFGSINQGNERDTVTVQVFSCTPF